jgi:hypothetical protein
MKRRRQTLNVVDRYVPFPAFNRTDVCSVKSRNRGEFLLRKVSLASFRAQIPREAQTGSLLRTTRLDHNSSLPRLTTLNLQTISSILLWAPET